MTNNFEGDNFIDLILKEDGGDELLIFMELKVDEFWYFT